MPNGSHHILVARQHHYMRETGGLKLANDARRLGLEGVRHFDQPANVPTVTDNDDGVAVCLQGFGLTDDIGLILPALNGIPMRTEPELLVVEYTGEAFAFQDLRIRRSAPGATFSASALLQIARASGCVKHGYGRQQFSLGMGAERHPGDIGKLEIFRDLAPIPVRRSGTRVLSLRLRRTPRRPAPTTSYSKAPP